MSIKHGSNRFFPRAEAGGEGLWQLYGASVVGLQLLTNTVAIGATAMTSTEKLRVVGGILVDDPTNTSAYLELRQGQNAAASPAGSARIRYNGTTNVAQISVNGGVYATLATAAGTAPADATYLINGANAALANAVNVQSYTAGLFFQPTADSVTAFQFRTSGGTNVLDLDTTNSRIGIGTAAPGATLHVTGGVTVDGSGTISIAANAVARTANIFTGNADHVVTVGQTVSNGMRLILAAGNKPQLNGQIEINTGGIVLTQTAFTTGGNGPPIGMKAIQGAHTGLFNTTSHFFQFDGNTNIKTYVQPVNADDNLLYLQAQRLDSAGAGGVIVNATTLRISAAPSAASGNLAITTARALWVEAGLAQFGGDLRHSGTNLGFFGAAVAAQQTSGANLTNNVTAGGVNDTIANYTDLVLYANDAAAIRNDIYQLARKLKQVNDALRLYGLLT